MARLRRNIQTPTPIIAKAAKPPITPPMIAPKFNNLLAWPVDVLVGPVIVIVDGGRRESVELLDGESERVEGTGARSSGRPPAAFAATGSNLSPT